MVTATLLINETALFGLSAAVNALNTALLRLVTGDLNASVGVVNHPLPLVKNEAAVTLSHMAGTWVLMHHRVAELLRCCRGSCCR